jgi:2-oxoglutarate ferredoxin oxidoreductase subunit alpha
MLAEQMEEVNLKLQTKYRTIQENEVRYQLLGTDDAEYLVVAFGLAARIAHRGVQLARANGHRVGLVRPITLFPYPDAILRELSEKVKGILVVEMNAGQMVEDVRLAVEGRVPVRFYGRMGGVIPSPDEVAHAVDTMVTEVSTHSMEVH